MAGVGAQRPVADGAECRFVMPPKKKPRDRAIPKVSQLSTGPAPPVPPPAYVVAKLIPCELIFAIDIETNDLVRGNTRTWVRDQFGLMSKASPETLSALRIVQIGWAVGTSRGDMVVKERLVRPEGFVVTTDATKKHRITHEMAAASGVPLQDALKELVTEALECGSRGGRVCSHHLGFDAGVIYEELGRSGLESLKDPWALAVRGRDRHDGSRRCLVGSLRDRHRRDSTRHLRGLEGFGERPRA